MGVVQDLAFGELVALARGITMQQFPARPRYAPTRPLPPYAYVPGAGLPHPVNDPRGHLHSGRDHEAVVLPLPLVPFEVEGEPGRLGAAVAASEEWRYAVDLFNHGFGWEAHEAWEGFWNALGRTTAAAAHVQGLIHLAAAGVKIREGRPNGVARHARRARELLADPLATTNGKGVFGITPLSIAAVLRELEGHVPACWHTATAPVVGVLDTTLELAQPST